MINSNHKTNILLGAVTLVLIVASIWFFNRQSPKDLKQEHFSIQVDGGNFFCANRNADNLITADKPYPYGWETFTFFYLDDNHVKIRSYFKSYIAVNDSGVLQSNVRFSGASVFEIKPLGDDLYNLSPENQNLFVDGNQLVKVGASANNTVKLKLAPMHSTIAEEEAASAEKTKIHPFYINILLIALVLVTLFHFVPAFRIPQKLLYIVPVLILPYLLYRAYNLSFVIDEAWSYDILVNKPYYFKALIFDNNHTYIANNHVLNTIFGYISNTLFGNSPFSMRIFNVLAFIMYAYYAIQLLTYFAKSNASMLLGIVFLFFNPYMLEYFSLYRGYGLSLAFLSGFLYCFSQLYFEAYKQRTLILGIAFSLLAIYSNFALLFPVFVIQLAYFIYLMKEEKLNDIISNKTTWIFAAGAVLIIPAVSNILILSDQNELYFGGGTSFVKDSLNSIIEYSFFTLNQLGRNAIIGIFFLLFFTSLFFTKHKTVKVSLIVILGIILLSTFLNIVAESKFVIERASVYLLPFMAFFAIIMYDLPIKNKIYRYTLSVCLMLLSLSAVKMFINKCNLEKTTTWVHDVDNDKILDDILAYNNNADFSLGVFWIFINPMEYYANYKGINQLKKLESLEAEPINKEADFYYLRTVDLKNTTFEYEVVKEYPNSQSILIKRK